MSDSNFDKNELKMTITINSRRFTFYSLESLEKKNICNVCKLPYTLRIILESILRNLDGKEIKQEHLFKISSFSKNSAESSELPFKPTRVIMQDFTGVPAIVDLAALREALHERGFRPAKVNPTIPVHLIVDHSIQLDRFGCSSALEYNEKLEIKRNIERYKLLKWAAGNFNNFTLIPPSRGIIHQINLEHLASVVTAKRAGEEYVLYPDTLIGTDSHTPMINSIGVLGWGIGGIEAEAAILGKPLSIKLPEIVGLRISGEMAENVTPTDVVLTLVHFLREKNVVGKFIECFGEGVEKLSLTDRALISNMTPEYGATVTFFPVDSRTISYLKLTGRTDEHIAIIESYLKEQGLFREQAGETPQYSETLEFNLSEVEPCIAGPKRPQDKIPLKESTSTIKKIFSTYNYQTKECGENHQLKSTIDHRLVNGSVVIAAITSCTNTSNPFLMFSAALLAKNAVKRGLRIPWYVKTSLAPGSRVVYRYLEKSGLLPYLEALGFHLVGFGCTTCIGNSGPLRREVEETIVKNDLNVCSVISGNRNFEGRIHPLVKSNFLASPPLVIAYAIAGNIQKDLLNEPISLGPNGEEIYLKELWPEKTEVERYINSFVTPDLFREEYSNITMGNRLWEEIETDKGELFTWNEESTYIRKPPFFEKKHYPVKTKGKIENARILALFGDSITTDHISPAGKISEKSPAGKWLLEHGVHPEDFHTYGARRGNHEVMLRGTFSNPRLRNLLVKDKTGGYTIYFPENKILTIYEAAMKYMKEETPLVIIAGKEYGTGSSRDWAAKGTALLGIRVVIAESFERIHRSNLIQMGVLPLQFEEGENAENLGLNGSEMISIEEPESPRQRVKITASRNGNKETIFYAIARIDTHAEFLYYKNGGILNTVLLELMEKH